MAKRKRAAAPARDIPAADKFSIGQQVVLVLDASSGWERANGEPGVVVSAKRYGVWKCSALEARFGPAQGQQEGSRYAVRWKGGVANFEEHQLRAIYEGEELSTWEQFRKLTGIAINTPTVAA